MAALGTSNITATLVKNTLGENSRDVGTLCSSDKINVESKFKPVSYPAVSITEAEQILTNYGISEDSIGNIQVGLVNPPTTLKKWVYNKPTGTSESPYRLGDFKKYDHTAKFKEGDWGIILMIQPGNIIEFNELKIVKATDLLSHSFVANIGFKTSFDHEHLLTPKQLLFINDNISEEDDGKLLISIYKKVPYDSTITRYVRDAVVYSPTIFTDMVSTSDIYLPIKDKGDANLNYPIDLSFIDNNLGMFVLLQLWIHFSRGNSSITPAGYERCLAITADGSPHTDTYYIDGGAWAYINDVKLSLAIIDPKETATGCTGDSKGVGLILEGRITGLPGGDYRYTGDSVKAIPGIVYYWYGKQNEDGTYSALTYKGNVSIHDDLSTPSSVLTMDTENLLVRANFIVNLEDLLYNSADSTIAAGGFAYTQGSTVESLNNYPIKSEISTIDMSTLNILTDKGVRIWAEANREENTQVPGTTAVSDTIHLDLAATNASLSSTEVGTVTVFFRRADLPMPDSVDDDANDPKSDAKQTVDFGSLTGKLTKQFLLDFLLHPTYKSKNYYVYIWTPNNGQYYCKVNKM